MSNMYNSFSAMGQAFKSKAYTYKITVPPVNLPVSLAEVKSYCKLDELDASEDALLTLFIQSASGVFEQYTNRVLVTTTFATFRDCFEGCYEIRRSPLQTIDLIQYLKGGLFTSISSAVYDVTDEESYSRVVLAEDQSWPTDKDNRLQSVKIIFKAGYGDDSSDIPAEIRNGLLAHVCSLYENRGDCCQSSPATFDNLPNASRIAYNQYKIRSLIGNTWRC